MPAITATDLSNAKLDTDHIANLAMSTSLTATDRLGNTKQTIAGVFAGMNAQAAAVDTAGAAAIASINADKSSVTTNKSSALGSIAADVSEVEAVRLPSLASITADVAEVDAAKTQAVAVDIPAILAALALRPNRGAWVTGRVYPVFEVVSNGGAWYECVSAHTAGATFAGDSSRWVLYQGVTTGDLSVSTGAALIGTAGNMTQAARNAAYILAEQFGCIGGDVVTTVNKANFETAMAAAVAAKVPLVSLNGPYRINAAITVPDNLTWIAGGGPAEVSPLLKQTSTTANHLNITGKNLFVIGRLSFGHSGTPTAGICLNVTGVNAKNNNFAMVDSSGCFELFKASEGMDGVHINHARTRNALGQLNVWGDSVYTGTPLYNRNVVIAVVDFENDPGVNYGINWNAMLQYCRDWSIGRLGGRINRGTDCFKCYCNDVSGVAANLRWSERLYFGPVTCTNQESDVIRIKEGDYVTLDRCDVSDAAIGLGAVFVRGLYTDPAFGGNLRATGVKVSRIGQHGIYLRHLGPGLTILDGCESTDNSRQTAGQSSNFLVDDGVSNWEVRGGTFAYPSNGAKASTVLTLTGNPTNAYTMTLNGQALTFATVASSATQIQLGDTSRLTALNITDFINNSQLPEVRRLTATLASGSEAITMQIRERGTGGNAYTVAKTGSLMSWTGGLVSSTLLGGTGTNAVSRNIYINGTSCRNWRMMGVDAKGGATANVTNLGQGVFVDCIGIDNATDVVLTNWQNGTATNGAVNMGALYGAIYEFIGYSTGLSSGSCSIQASIDGVAQGGSSISITNSQRATGIICVNGGTGYTGGDTLTVSGGTASSVATIKVVTVDGSGRITSYSLLNTINRYTAIPSNAVAVTGGTGSGATFNLKWSTNYLQMISVPYRFDARNAEIPIIYTISSASTPTFLSVSLLFRKVTQV